MRLRTDRLMQLADKLRTVSPEQFDMNVFACSVRPGFNCQTEACAAGWAATIPAFRRAGYRMAWKRTYVLVGSDDVRRSWAGEPTYMGMAAKPALGAFFGLTLSEVADLFYSRFQDSPKEKAAQIEAFCRKYEEGRLRR